VYGLQWYRQRGSWVSTGTLAGFGAFVKGVQAAWAAAMTALCSCWTQLVRALCGDPRRNRQPDPTERQQLLSVDAHSDTHISTAPSAALCEDVPDSPSGCTTLIVMRHGHRKDEESPKWHVSANRPWDPPLSSLGRQQVRRPRPHPPMPARGGPQHSDSPHHPSTLPVGSGTSSLTDVL
jgi:hypothetical protein